jgi:hypothetical protein
MVADMAIATILVGHLPEDGQVRGISGLGNNDYLRVLKKLRIVTDLSLLNELL